MRHQSAILSEKGTIFDRCVTQNTRATPDPNHHGQAMRSPMRTELIKSQGLEMQGPWSRGVFQTVFEHLSLPKIEFSALASTTRLKKGG